MNAIQGQSARKIAIDFAHLHARRAQLEPGEVYQRYLLAVCQLTGASSASLLVEPKQDDQHRALLIHEGGSPPVPELASEEVAAAAIALLGGNRSAERDMISYFPSAESDSCLLRVGVGLTPWQVGDDPQVPREGERRNPGHGNVVPEENEAVWLGLRYKDSSIPGELSRLRDPGSEEPTTAAEWLAHILVLGASRSWETCQLSWLLRDPTSQLPGRAEFQARLRNAFMTAARNHSTLGLLLINPDEFGVINQRLDSESGDRALAEVAHLLRDCLRSTDPVFRYGGAVFAALMPKADENAVDAVASKIREAMTGAYLDGAVRLSFSVGAVVYQSTEQADANLDEMGLLRRADHALNLAKRAGGDCSVLWNPDEPELPGAGQDRLSGIFTANAEKDYRNMLLLWDTITVISSGAEEKQIAEDFVARIHMSLKTNRIALIAGRVDDGLSFLAAAQCSPTTGEPWLDLSAQQRQLLQQVEDTRSAQHLEFELAEAGTAGTLPHVAYAVPLLAGERCLGSLYIDGPQYSVALDSSDQIFLKALANQVALALDRADLAARWKEESEKEHRRLRVEVQELRQVVTSAKLVYRSPEMQTVLDTLRAVAPTDVTILVNGESGTGKEMLARAVHEMGSRKDEPLVTVDCGAIAHNLLEAELFGYVKGAYTGAESASEGRIVQADGGTIFLDEIGEIPLDVQAKFLRFVQEKEINPVGATQSRRVNVRIVAATNRDLATEVAAGRFREDLFYRLKVVTLTAPSLRDRPTDILPLAKHFLEKFALQYEKGVHKFSDDAERLMREYAWPGNVRELQNCVLRAVVLSNSDTIGSQLLQFAGESGRLSVVPDDRETEIAKSAESSTAAVELPDTSAPFETLEAAAPNCADPWQAIQLGVTQQVELALVGRGASAVPLGRWLSEDLLLAVDDRAWGVARRAAARMGVAETTYRRQLDKARQAESAGLLQRNTAWSNMQECIGYLAQSLEDEAGVSVLERARQILLAEVSARTTGNDNLGATLMGVTVPTYRRWVGGL